MSRIISRLRELPFLKFGQLFTREEGRRGAVVSFLALMELARERLVDVVQTEPFGPIYVRRPGAEPDE